MTDERKTANEQKARRVAQWLAQNREGFEGEGIGEDELASAIGMARIEVTEAIDHLEAREEVVRVPRALTTPPQFLLKPGRGWRELRDEILGAAGA